MKKWNLLLIHLRRALDLGCIFSMPVSLICLAGPSSCELFAQGVALAEGYQDHGGTLPGESVKGHALYGGPRAGSMIGMIANGLNGSHGSSTPPGGFSAHG